MGIWKICWFSAVLFCVAAILSCSGGYDRNLMEGTYVHSGSGEFSVADDTLVVEHMAGRNYAVHRSTGFNLLTDGDLGVRQYEKEEWSAIAEEGEESVLLEQRWGKRLLFRQDPGVLEVGRRVYVKLD